MGEVDCKAFFVQCQKRLRVPEYELTTAKLIALRAQAKYSSFQREALKLTNEELLNQVLVLVLVAMLLVLCWHRSFPLSFHSGKAKFCVCALARRVSHPVAAVLPPRRSVALSCLSRTVRCSVWQLNVENSINAELRLHILKKRYSHLNEAFDKMANAKKKLGGRAGMALRMNVFGAMHDAEEPRHAI